MAFNSAIIVKPKKFKGSDKVKASNLKGIEEFIPEELEEADKVKETEFKATDKIKPGNLMGTIKPKSEELLSIDVMLSDAKKSKEAPKDANAFDKEAGYFKVKKDKEGMFEESGETAKKKYLEKIKSRKGM